MAAGHAFVLSDPVTIREQNVEITRKLLKKESSSSIVSVGDLPIASPAGRRDAVPPEKWTPQTRHSIRRAPDGASVTGKD